VCENETSSASIEIVDEERPTSSVDDKKPSTSTASPIKSVVAAADTPITPTSSASGSGLFQVESDDATTKQLRRLLFYFIPPNYKYSKKEIGSLPKEKLLELDLSEFFQSYEIGLKKFVSEHQKAAETAQNELKQLRQLCVDFANTQGVKLLDGVGIEGVDKALKLYLKSGK